MPPPYNYDNALLGYISYRSIDNSNRITKLETKMDRLKIVTKPTYSVPITLYKNAGKQTIDIENWELFFDTTFSYTSSTEPTIHKPKITLRDSGGQDYVYTLSLNRTTNTVSIDLFTRMITVYDEATCEIIQQFKIDRPYNGFEKLSFENFDDIEDSEIRVTIEGVGVNE